MSTENIWGLHLQHHTLNRAEESLTFSKSCSFTLEQKESTECLTALVSTDSLKNKEWSHLKLAVTVNILWSYDRRGLDYRTQTQSWRYAIKFAVSQLHESLVM